MSSNRTYNRVLYKVTYEYEAEIRSTDIYGDTILGSGVKAWQDHIDYIVGPCYDTGKKLVEAWVTTRWNGRYRNVVVTELHGIDGEVEGGHY